MTTKVLRSEHFFKEASAYLKYHKEQRIGQAYMNYLYIFDEDAYRRLHWTYPEFDIFYLENSAKRFNLIYTHWTKIVTEELDNEKV